jgi:anthranilate synthase component 2
MKEPNQIKIFVVDNYDSFTYNLVHYLESFNTYVTVKRNDEFELSDIENYDKIVLSPGPGLPKNAGLMNDVIKMYHDKKPILGICLGHQALAEFYGAELINLTGIYHGMSSFIEIDTFHFLFKDLNSTIEVGRYHSWGIKNMPPCLTEIASNKSDKLNMAIQHQKFKSTGVQFHPESIMTKDGLKMIKNWIFN